ncbi:MAG TPA: ABC transporter transmembrane domain-containing protein, partial [Gemmatimonadaceae bacterium]
MHAAVIDQEIITRYAGQPARLPADLRAAIERAWGDQPVQLYAHADLDGALRLTSGWLALGPAQVAVARRVEAGGWSIQHIDRARITAVRETPGLSANALLLLGEPDDPPLAVVRYTHRQRGAFENIRFVLEEAQAGRSVAPDDADRVYADAVARPVRDAQALVARRRAAVMLRLLAYLRPYRRQVTFGMASAAVITMVSLVPPWLAGYVIDQVVRPAQEGILARDRAMTIAWLAVAGMVVVYGVRQISAHLRLRLMSVLGELVARDLRAELYEHIQRLSLAFFSRKKTGSLITRVTSDTDR